MVLTADSVYQRLGEAKLVSSDDFHRLTFTAMGTECQVCFACTSPARARQFKDHILQWIGDFETRYSRFLPDSLISRINDSAGVAPVAIDSETGGLFRLCDWFYWATAGVFDPSSLPLLRVWDYHSAREHLPDDDEILSAWRLVGWQRAVRRNGTFFLPERGMGIDLGGIGKEYAVDRVVEMALERGMSSIIVDFGHDVRVNGEPPEGGPWRIGLEDALDPGRCWAGVAVRDRAVCSSGDYLRHLEIDGHRYGHILDPRSGYPVNNGCRSVTVIAPTCTAAGILSTSVFIMGREQGMAHLDAQYQAEGCMTTDKERYHSKGIHAYLM